MKVLIVYCHPNPESFVAAVRDAAVEGFGKGGHDVRLIDLYADDFNPELSDEEIARHTEAGSRSADIEGYVEDLLWAEALAFVYPTWWGSQPAMLKGWFDRVWVAGVAWELPAGSSTLRPLLNNIKRILIVTTHGSSRWVNRLQGEPGKRVLTRSIRLMCSRRTRTRWCSMYDLETAVPQRRREFLERVQHIAEVYD